MTLEIRKVQVWFSEVADLTGAAAAILAQLARAGIDLQFVFSRPHPRNPDAGLLFLAPISGEQQIQMARRIGLAPALDVAMLYIQGPNRAGIGCEIMSQLAVAGVPMQGISISGAGDRFGAYVAFNSPDDASKAVQVLANLEV